MVTGEVQPGEGYIRGSLVSDGGQTVFVPRPPNEIGVSWSDGLRDIIPNGCRLPIEKGSEGSTETQRTLFFAIDSPTPPPVNGHEAEVKLILAKDRATHFFEVDNPNTTCRECPLIYSCMLLVGSIVRNTSRMDFGPIEVRAEKQALLLRSHRGRR